MIQRSYSLPSCTLLVEGISTGGDVMSILTSFNCRFNHHPEPIVGGLDLLNTLVKVVGAYAQALKSNTALSIPEQQVRLEPQTQYSHLLSVSLNEAEAHNPKQLQIKLNTIQLFDLMESLDRLCGDPMTLPDLKLVTQISDFRSQSPLSKQTIPAIAGVISFAIAATALYLIPTPKPQPKPAQTVPVQTSPLPLPNISTPPSPSVEASPSDTPTAEATPEPAAQ